MTRRTFVATLGAIQFAERSLDWLSVEMADGAVRLDWPASDELVSMGSLLKPFLLVSFAATHKQFPEIECRGAASGCWRASGHGRQGPVEALANSCNVYFRALVNQLDRAALDATSLHYGLRAPSRSWGPDRLIGLGEGWAQAPADVGRAFASLAKSRTDPSAKIALSGMARCARCGTAKEVGFRCYAKTGTAACSHGGRGLGDGFAVAIYPLSEPRCVLLVRRHGTTGAETAREVRRIAGARLQPA